MLKGGCVIPCPFTVKSWADIDIPLKFFDAVLEGDNERSRAQN
jgi:hypothetical protein